MRCYLNMGKRKKWTDISPNTKRIVYERDGERCVLCGSYYGLPEAHFVPRSKGGAGNEYNIVTLCRQCHAHFDQGRQDERKAIREILRKYLINKYPDWSEESVIYRKGQE